MRQVIVILLAVGVIGTVAVALNSNVDAASQKSPLVGRWEAIDLDGSFMQMKITPGLVVILEDDWASSCPSGGPATAKGKGSLAIPELLEVELKVRCTVDHSRFVFAETLEYVSAGDVLLGSGGVVWTRE